MDCFHEECIDLLFYFTFYYYFSAVYMLLLFCCHCNDVNALTLFFSQSDFFLLIVTGMLIGWLSKRCQFYVARESSRFWIEETLVNVGAWANRGGWERCIVGDFSGNGRAPEMQFVLGVTSEVLFLTHVAKALLLLLWLLLPVKNVTHVCYKSMFRMF